MPKVDTTKCRVHTCPYEPKSDKDVKAHVHSNHFNGEMFTCPHCPHVAKQMSNLNSHIDRAHSGPRQRLPCPFDGCTSTQASQRHLDDHIAKKHHGLGFIHCPVETCEFQAQYKNVMDMHVVSIHSDDKPFVCTFAGCDYATKRRDTLESHLRRHTGERPFVCNEDGCTKTFAHRQTLTQHLLLHQPSQPWLYCSMCAHYKTKRPARLREHVNEVHMQVKPLVCEYDDCDYCTCREYAMRQHVNAIHEKKELYTCSHDTCDFTTYWPPSAQHHNRYGHTQSGDRVRNGKEHQVVNGLKQHFDVQQPYAIRQAHLTHCRRKFIHVDAAIALPERDLLVLIECDEQQHKDPTIYNVCDELTRVQDATHGIRVSGETAHVLWIRFNPDTYTVTSASGEVQRQNDTLEKRVQCVVEFIEEFVPADNESEQDMTIAYMYYDVVNGSATVTQHEEYFDELKPCTMTVV